MLLPRAWSKPFRSDWRRSRMFIQARSGDNGALLSSSCFIRRQRRPCTATCWLCLTTDPNSPRTGGDPHRNQLGGLVRSNGDKQCSACFLLQSKNSVNTHMNNVTILCSLSHTHKNKIFPLLSCCICCRTGYCGRKALLKCFQTFTVGLLCLIVP